MFLKIRVIDGEYIVKISRGVVKQVYKVVLCRFVKVRQQDFHVESTIYGKKNYLNFNFTCVAFVVYILVEVSFHISTT